MIALFLSRYWQQLAIAGITLAVVVMGSLWLHHDRAAHEQIGEARVQKLWDDAKKIQQAAADKQRAINQADQDEQHARADRAERDLAAANLSRKASDADWQSRIDRLRLAKPPTPVAGGVPEVHVITELDNPATLRSLLNENLNLLGEGRSLLAECAAEVVRDHDSWPLSKP